MSNQNIEIVPSNVASNAKISFQGGTPVIQFIIGEQDRLLLGNSLRFTGKFRTLLSSASANVSSVSTLAMSDKLGVYSTIDTLTIKSQRTGQTIESIRNYNRFLASYLPVTSSQQDNMGHMYDSALILPNYAAQQQTVVNLPSSSSTQNHFCMSLPCGLFNGGEPIPLMEEAVGGLLVELHLAPDSQVFHSSTNDNASATSEAFYEFTDVSLAAELMTPAADVLQQLKSRTSATYEYNSISSYYQTINSANGIINFQLGLSRVLGVFANIVPAAHINNTVYDGLATMYPTNATGEAAVIKELFFTRNGSKFPIDYNINTLLTDEAAITETTDPFSVDPQIVYNYMNAVQKFASITRTSLRPQNTQYSDSTRFDKDTAFGGCGWGLGVAFDTVSDAGVDFSRVNFGINMSLDLTTDSPQAFYLFAHNKQTLVFGAQGLQVLS
tara:strand:- start:4588 stop:5910 length:1323 start_codon:yes stop_codon:yes gene_type:complete